MPGACARKMSKMSRIFKRNAVKATMKANPPYDPTRGTVVLGAGCLVLTLTYH